jgi:hypothetical protein
MEVSDRYSAVKLTAALPQLGQEPPVAIFRKPSSE